MPRKPTRAELIEWQQKFADIEEGDEYDRVPSQYKGVVQGALATVFVLTVAFGIYFKLEERMQLLLKPLEDRVTRLEARMDTKTSK